MAKFKFKLDGVLKIREFKEKEAMNAIAEVVAQIEETKAEIRDIHSAIDRGYESQDSLKDGAIKGHQLSFYPMFFKGKNEHLKNCEAKLAALEKKYQRRVQEYAEAKGEVKVIEKLKDKEFAAFKKEMEKKVEENREEFVVMQMSRRKKRTEL